MSRIAPALAALAVAALGIAPPAAAQYRADARVADFEPAAARAVPDVSGTTPPGAPAALFERTATSVAAERGDGRLMFLGGAVGATLGYLIGWGAAAGVASVLDTEGVRRDAYVRYVRAVPSVSSAIGAATGTVRASCIKLLFGSVYPLDSCADARLAVLGALPGAVLDYVLPDGRAGYTAAALAAEAAGAALMGTVIRQARTDEPEW